MIKNIERERIDIKYVRYDHSQRKDIEGLHHIKSLPWLSVVQSVEGSYEISLGDGSGAETGEGGIFVAPSQIKQNILHHSNPSTRKMFNRWIFIDVIINEKYRLEHLFDFPLILPEEIRCAMNDLFDELSHKTDICDRMSVYYQMVKLLLRVAKPKKMMGGEEMLGVVNYMYKNYKNPLSISDLAQVAHMSESNFYARFKKQFGMSPIAYLNHYRLTLASDMLKQSSASVGEIAESVGFSDRLYFSRLFKRTFAISPKQYREL